MIGRRSSLGGSTHSVNEKTRTATTESTITTLDLCHGKLGPSCASRRMRWRLVRRPKAPRGLPKCNVLQIRQTNKRGGSLDNGTRPMKMPRRSAVVAISTLAAMIFAPEASAQAAKPAVARNVVLVHGAWADGSSWSEVIAPLQAAGLNVTAVQNPLTSLADSLAATRRALALQDGPTVLVAHSWGGTVISEAGLDPKVTALVYVAARAPDGGEDFVALSGKFPTMPCGQESRNTTVSPTFRRRLFSNISRTASRA